jgi:C4-dicarboxylate-specific signal transduction histidine kinase
VLWVRENAKAVRRAGDQLLILIACEDITERKRTEDALHQSRAELARVARVMTLGELAAAIAHEVNQPLTGLVSSGHACLRWLAAEPPNLEAARRAVERMLSDGLRAGAVVQRIQALVAKAPPRRDRLNMNEAVAEVIALVRTELQRNRIALQTELSDALPAVRGDRIQLQQVILNLIMNAIEAMGGISQAQRRLLLTSAQEGAHGVLLTVGDSGPGLDRNAPERVFDAFYTTKHEGMGMGLAISRTIVEAHGGRLSAAPNRPHGAVFELRLPAADGPDDAAAQARRP